MFEVDTNSGRITINGQFTGLHVTQARNGTIVYTPEGAPGGYKEHAMPHARYSLAHDAPRPLHATAELAEKYKTAGRAQFEKDARLLALRLQRAFLEKEEALATSLHSIAETKGSGPAYTAAFERMAQARADLQTVLAALDADQDD